MLDVRLGSRTAPRSGHDVTGPDINLDFLEAHFGCKALLGSSDVAQDHRPTEKKVPGTDWHTRWAAPGALALMVTQSQASVCQARQW